MKYDYRVHQKTMQEYVSEREKIAGLMAESVPRKAGTFKLSSWISISTGDWNFKIRTEYGDCFIECCESMGSLNYVWSFLEALCKGEKEAYWASDQEGCYGILVAKQLDAEHLRLLLFSEGWNEFTADSVGSPQHLEGMQLKLDIIIKRSHLICALWAELLNGYSGGDWKRFSDDLLFDGEKINTPEVLIYFKSRTKDLDLDRELFRSIKFGALFEIEQCLRQGANPNSLEKYRGYLSVTPLACGVIQSSIIPPWYELSQEVGYINKTPEEQKELAERFAAPKRQLDVLKLLLKYGAEPNYYENSHPWAITTLETAITSYAAPAVIELLLQHDAKITNDCWRWAKADVEKKRSNKLANHMAVLVLLRKYGEETIYYRYS